MKLCFLFSCLLAFTVSPLQMPTIPPALPFMPQEIIQTIMLQLSDTIGSPGVINEEDIPVIVKTITRLAQTNKYFYNILNQEDTTDALLQALGQRFKLSPLDVAANLKTRGAQLWLKSYMHRSGDYAHYLILQKIYSLADQVAQEAKKYDVSIDRKGWPTPKPYYHKTKQGFLLSAEEYPDFLYTPWGEVKLYGQGSGKNDGFHKVLLEFLKHFDWQFEGVAGIDEPKLKFWELTDANVMVPLTKAQVIAKRGQKVMILSSHCGHPTVYKLLKFEDITLPEPIDLAQSDYRSYESANMLWKLMEEEYKQEMQISSEESEKKRASCNYEVKKRNLPAPYEVVPQTAIGTISQVPDLCVQLIKKLSQQPLFTGNGMIVDKGKALPLESWNECRLCEILTTKANKLIDEKHQWHVHTFGCGNSQLYVSGNCLGDGLQLWLYEKNTPISLEELRNAYERVLHTIKHGWTATTLQENPYIMHKQSEEEWYLFINKNHHFDDANLIAIIASKVGLYDQFGSDNKIHVGDDWLQPERDRKDLYLWIRKDALVDFERAFGFNLHPHPSWNMGNKFRQSTREEAEAQKKDADAVMQTNAHE